MSGRLILTSSEADRFWSKVDMSGECWVWTRSADRRGYGNVRIRRRLYRSHRVAYELAIGPIPDGLLLRHRCDNPPCVRPAHLLPGTDWDNVHDTIDRGRKVQARGERIATAKLTTREVREIRQLASSGIMSGRAIGRLYSISHTMVQDIVQDRFWRHVGGAA